MLLRNSQVQRLMSQLSGETSSQYSSNMEGVATEVEPLEEVAVVMPVEGILNKYSVCVCVCVYNVSS